MVLGWQGGAGAWSWGGESTETPAWQQQGTLRPQHGACGGMPVLVLAGYTDVHRGGGRGCDVLVQGLQGMSMPWDKGGRGCQSPLWGWQGTSVTSHGGGRGHQCPSTGLAGDVPGKPHPAAPRSTQRHRRTGGTRKEGEANPGRSPLLQRQQRDGFALQPRLLLHLPPHGGHDALTGLHPSRRQVPRPAALGFRLLHQQHRVLRGHRGDGWAPGGTGVGVPWGCGGASPPG